MLSNKSAVVAAVLAMPAFTQAQNSNGGYWFDNAQDVLATMQQTYWNGSSWTTLQWIGAVLGTYLSTTNELSADGLGQYFGRIPNTNTTDASLKTSIEHYFSQTEAYFYGEDTTQILQAAYDDAQWVVLEWLEAIKFINLYDGYALSTLGRAQIANYSHRAHIFYNRVQDQFDTSLCDGGLTWNPALQTYKNAITNELFIASSIGMYLYYPGDYNSDPYPNPSFPETLPPLPSLAAHDPLLLQNAIKEYNWFKSQAFENAQGLIIDGFHLSPNQTTCNQADTMIYSYNQGVILSGLRGLWEATGNTTYLTDGYKYIANVINATGYQNNGSTLNSAWSGLGRNGIMEDYCDAAGNCAQDDLAFKGIYFHHLSLFCEPLPIQIPLVLGLTKVATTSLASSHARTCASYAPWIEINAQAALNTRNSTGDIIGEWWGAPALGQAQTGNQKFVVPKPAGAIDYINEPWLLETPEWSCQGAVKGAHGCENANDQQYRMLMRRMLTQRRLKQRRSSNQVFTVETQGQGLAVVLAAADINLQQPIW